MAVVAAGILLGGLAGPEAQPTKADSGWVPLFTGKDFSGLYVYSQVILDIQTQTKFRIEDGMIHAGASTAILATLKEYTHYKVRIDYRFGPAVGSGANAGLMVLVDNQQAKFVKAGRPRSLEVNCRRDNDYPWSLWAAAGLGPYFSTTVRPGTDRYLAKAEGGVAHTVDPSGDPQRTLRSAYPNTEKPPGQWNHGEAWVMGDSATFHLNGQLRTAGWNWKVKIGNQMVKVDSGGIALQTEGSEIWYRNWEIMELDPETRIPLHATRGCTDSRSPLFNPRAVVGDGSCHGTRVLAPRSRVRGAANLLPIDPALTGRRRKPELLRASDGRLRPMPAPGWYSTKDNPSR